MSSLQMYMVQQKSKSLTQPAWVCFINIVMGRQIAAIFPKGSGSKSITKYAWELQNTTIRMGRFQSFSGLTFGKQVIFFCRFHFIAPIKIMEKMWPSSLNIMKLKIPVQNI